MKLWVPVLERRARWAVIRGDSREILPLLPDASCHSVVCDPPSGTGFMGKSWDSFRRAENPNDVGRPNVFGRTSRTAPHSYGETERDAFISATAHVLGESFRLLTPGAFGVAWSLPRTSHWTGMAIEHAGFEVRDSIHHVFLNGFPKYLDIAKAFDKAAGVQPIRIERPTLGMATGSMADQWNKLHNRLVMPPPTTDEAKLWRGWATALKPAHEVWWLFRKPLRVGKKKATVIETIREYGTGALRADACEHCGFDDPDVRWPPNLVFSHGPTCTAEECHPLCPVLELEKQYGGPVSTFPIFRYEAKPQIDEKDEGCEEAGLPLRTAAEMTERSEGSRGLVMDDGKANPYAGTSGKARRNHHPTVKPVAFMRWLVRLITPPGGVVLDPYAGSGTTGVGSVPDYRFIGVEKDEDEAGRPLGYVDISRARLAHADPTGEAMVSDAARRRVEMLEV
jgi:DNA modification methylase